MPDEADDQALLSDEDRRRIAEVRDQLEREFAAAEARREAARRRNEIVDEVHARDRVSAVRRRRQSARSLRLRGFVLGCLVGAGVTLVTMGSLRVSAARSTPLQQGGSPGGEATPSAAPAELLDKGERADLEESVRDWIDATRRRDVAGQMAYYPAMVAVYYTGREVPRASVRAGKTRLVSDLDASLIRISQPEIVPQPGGRAVVRFRKRYVLDGPRVRRRGEGVQELEWLNTADGWKIVSERDVEARSRP